MSGEPEERWTVPDGWIWTNLSQLGNVVAGGTPSTKNSSFWSNEIHWISPADLTGYSAKTIQQGAQSISQIGLANSSAKLMPAGSVHFSSRAPIGYVVISSGPLATNQGFKSLVPASGVFNEYVYYYLMVSRDFARKRANGTTFLELSGKAFGNLPIPLAPAEAQYRIVAKIEELFSELDEGVESLKKAREQLKIYRQAVLKHAFEGKLTAQWREENKDKLEKPEQLLARIKQEREACYERQLGKWIATIRAWEKNAKIGRKAAKPAEFKIPVPIAQSELTELPNIPSSWQYVRLSEIAQIGSGMSVSKSRKPADPIEVPYLSVANVQRGRLDLSMTKFMKIERSQLAGFELRRWDILFNEGGDRDKLGRGWVWELQIEPCITQNHVFRASPFLESHQHSKWISHWGNTFGQLYFETQGKQTTNLASINKTVLSKFPVPLAPITEQEEIIRRIENQTETIDHMEHEVAKSLEQMNALRQSILKKAFSGQLVPQNPTDEPASKLLERIKAERAATAQNNSPSKRRPQAKAVA